MLVGCLHFTSQNAFSHLPRNTFGKLSYWLRELKVSMKLLTAVCNSLGTLTLASFLVAFLERVAFYLPHFCFPINNWAYGTADGLCPIPGTVTSKCDHRFLHFCMNLLTCSTCEKPNIYPSSDQESMVEIFRVNIITNKYCKRLDRIYIHILFLTFPWQRCFFSGTQYTTLDTALSFLYYVPSPSCRPSYMILSHFPNQVFRCVLSCIQTLLLLFQNNVFLKNEGKFLLIHILNSDLFF